MTTLVIFSCQRTEMLIRMLRSFSACCLDKEHIQRVVLSDDNSSFEQLGQAVQVAKSCFTCPIIVRHRIEERGLDFTWIAAWHEVATRYAFNMEEDWVFTQPGRYIEYAQGVMETDQTIAQVAFSYHAPGSHYVNYEASEQWCDSAQGRYLRWPDGHHWPGYTNNPNVIHMERVRTRMFHPLPHYGEGVEYNFGERFRDSGLHVAFMPEAVTEHIGTSGRAFDLNKTKA